jgi:hypothetical protein
MGPVMCTSSWWAEGEVSTGDTKSVLIEELGDGGTNFARGEEEVYARATVTRDGAKAENVMVPASDVAAKPRSLDHLHAAAVPHAEARRLLMAALERIPPQLEVPQEASEAAETAREEQESAEPSATGGAQEGVQRRSWWRRIFGS